MKAYLRVKTIKGCRYKKDFHIIRNNRKEGNWWEDLGCEIARSTYKIELKNEVNETYIKSREMLEKVIEKQEELINHMDQWFGNGNVRLNKLRKELSELKGE
jgi:hypothetical protein